jgi:hypothetical protein
MYIYVYATATTKPNTQTLAQATVAGANWSAVITVGKTGDYVIKAILTTSGGDTPNPKAQNITVTVK